MARALIVGCGCRGRMLGETLVADGWQVRGTARDEQRLAPIAAAGIQAAPADPAEVGTVFELIEGVSLVFWLMGSAEGEPEEVTAVNGPRLERLLEKLVDTPVRGLVYEGAGPAPAEALGAGAVACREAAERWRIPIEVVEAPHGDWEHWLDAMVAAGRRTLGL